MRAMEQAAIDSGAVTGLDLMERAGQGVVAAVLAEWPDLALTAHRAVVLCGPGNNGGDGFVVARLLKERGWEVEVFLYGDARKLPPDARVNAERWSRSATMTALGFPAIAAERLVQLRASVSPDPAQAERPRLVIDALFGTGLTRPAHGLSPIFDLRASTSPDCAKWVAVDMPSGLCSDSGRLYPPKDPATTVRQGLRADLTVTFHRRKPGHLLGDGPTVCGKVGLIDIGLPDLDDDDLDALVRGAADGGAKVALAAPDLRRLAKTNGHKYHYGHALIVAGPPAHGGAARMAARGAIRIGAGLVTVGAPDGSLVENAARLDAIMLRRVDGPDDLRDLLADRRINAVCLGPGLGHERAKALLPVVLEASAPPPPSGVPGLTRDLDPQAAPPARGPGSAAGAAQNGSGAPVPLAVPGLTRDLDPQAASPARGPGSAAGAAQDGSGAPVPLVVPGLTRDLDPQAASPAQGPGSAAGAAQDGSGAPVPLVVPGLTRDLDGQAAPPDPQVASPERGPGLAAGAARDSDGTPGPARQVVLDADALTHLAKTPALFAALHARCVLTPHAGEFARLFPDLAERLNKPATEGPAYSKVDATRDAARRAGCTVVFKGPDTVIADPQGQCSINPAAYDRAAPWLATAGTGDTLAGMICGLLARDFAPMQAAETAAWLHVECALSFGPGLIAEDLSEELPKVFRRLGL